MVPSSDAILSFYDSLPDTDKTPKGFIPRSIGRITYCDWFLGNSIDGYYVTRLGRVIEGRGALRVRGLYLLEKALNKRARAQRRAAKAASGS